MRVQLLVILAIIFSAGCEILDVICKLIDDKLSGKYKSPSCKY